MLAEEKAIIPGGGSRDSRGWKQPGKEVAGNQVPPVKPAAANASPQSSAGTPATPTPPAPADGNPLELAKTAAEMSKPWLEDAFQLDDKAKREAAIARVRAAMTSGKPVEVRAGIEAFGRLAPIEFDKASFRSAVRPLLSSPDPATRGAAAGALTITGTEAEDLPRIFALADDPAPEVRDILTSVIVQVMKHDLRDKAATDAILKLMAKLPRDSRSVAHALWGSKFSPEIEAGVLKFSRDLERASNGDVGYNFVYGALSTQANKSEASCKRLIELLAHQDTTNIAGRCAWGLQQGVSQAQYPLVADAMLKLLDARSDPYLRTQALRCLGTYAGPQQAKGLQALLAKPGVTGDFRKSLEDILARAEAGEEKPLPLVAAEASTNKPDATIQPETPEIEVEWKGKWWPAKVLKKEGDRTQIHYIGYGAEWDEWVEAGRIRLLAAAGEPKAVASAEAPAGDIAQVRAKVAELEKKVAETEEEKNKERRVATLLEKNQQAARKRGAEDRQRYSEEQLKEIETLYQVANTKGKRTDEAKASLKQLLEKYDKANRTGCALLYLGQASEGDERLQYLTRAVEKFSDCYYYNGCQVGGYGRYVLALTLWEKGEKESARALFEEIKTTYKEATDHRARPMPELVEAAEKELAKQP